VDGNIATLRLCNPDYANRLSPADLKVIQSHIQTVNQNTDILVLRVLAEGKYFCSGYDISSLAADSAPSSIFLAKRLIYSNRPDL